jgi:hypothetical protein
VSEALLPVNTLLKKLPRALMLCSCTPGSFIKGQRLWVSASKRWSRLAGDQIDSAHLAVEFGPPADTTGATKYKTRVGRELTELLRLRQLYDHEWLP